ncbi:MAG: ATP-binding cassette domain-containing protein, partial [Bacteroides sp.]|nr:ATP-binding cassette domain-containing protein [Bacteroides sp.]
GKNGEGKSTLVKCIMGEIPFTGHLKIGHNVRIGYFAQNQAQMLDGDITVFDTIDHVATGDIRTRIRDILGAFMFGGEASDKYVRVLSGGEKTRLAMIKLLLEPVNLLILDEPTNHLDMTTKDILKQSIKDFDGTVIVVSHDREFLDGLVEKVYEFGGGKVRECLGGIYDFLEKKKIENLDQLQLSKSLEKTVLADTASSEPRRPSVGSGNYAEMKEREKALRKARRLVSECEDEIASIEQQIAGLEARLAEGCTDHAVFAEHGEMQKRLDEAMERWEQASADLDSLS